MPPIFPSRFSTLGRAIVSSLVIAGALPEAPAQATGPSVVAAPEKGWPQFRGPRRDGTSSETGLLQSWPEAGPKSLWSVEALGRGYSSPIIAAGRIYITGDVAEELRIFALDLQGKPIWQASNGASWKGEYPAARATLTYSEGHLYHENAHGRVACLDAATGREVWAVNLLEQFGGQNITWGLSECLLVDDKAVYATAGGKDALVVALDKKTGSVLWKTPGLRDSEGEQPVENPSYASPILIEFTDRKYVIGSSLRHLYCVDAATGALQWTQRFPTTYSVISMMPALVGNGVFMTAPHGKGGRLFDLIAPTVPDGRIGAKERWTTPLDTLQGCVIQSGGRIVGSYYGGRKGWAALNAQTGETLYTLPDTTKGAPLVADGCLYALCEDGWMLLMEPAEKEFRIISKFRFAKADQRDAWAHPVILDGKLYLRFHEKLVCYDVRSP